MDQLIPSLDKLLTPLAVVFRKEVFDLFRRMVAAWIICLGRHTICRVWETTGQARQRNHAAAYRLFSQAVWNFDEVARVLADFTVRDAANRELPASRSMPSRTR